VRVVHLAAYGGPYGGSFVPMLAAAREGVERRGWSFEAVFTPGVERWSWYEALRSQGVRARVAPALDTRRAVAWVRTLLQEDPTQTLLHTHFSRWDVPAALAARGRPGTHVVWHVHTPLLSTAKARATNLVKFGVLGRAADRLLCVGPEIEHAVRARLAPPGRTRLFPNGIDFEHFVPPDAAERAAARAQLELPPAATVLVSFVWDWERKGGPLFLDAVARLRARGRDVIAAPVVLGKRLQALAAEHAHDAAVRPLEASDDVRPLYAAADVFVTASRAEGMPFAMLEALACGTPVVASDIPSHSFVGDDLPARRLAARDGASIAAAIEAELDDASEARAARVGATRARLEERFSLAGWRERLMTLYSELAPDAGPDAEP
jgi:glycosyltransferase involved in cell wall biosynthesis